jgi:hypothetical protein
MGHEETDPATFFSSIVAICILVGLLLGCIYVFESYTVDSYREIDYDVRQGSSGNACALWRICSEYQTLRNQCATAGDYDSCMSIKFGTAGYSSAKTNCSEDGHINDARANDVNFIHCLFQY